MSAPDAQLRKKIRFEQARRFYLDPKSPGHLNAFQSLMLAGYTKNSANALAYTLFSKDPKHRTPSVASILPKDVKSAAQEIRSWFKLMTKWRIALEKEKDPVKLGSRTFAVISAHIERLCKIFGFLAETTKMPDVNITVNLASMSSPEQYTEVKSMLQFLIERVQVLEEELKIPADARFSYNN